jgi:hypothetical protein
MFLSHMVLNYPQSWARTRNGLYAPSSTWSRTRSADSVRGESEADSRGRSRSESRSGSGTRADVRSLSRSQEGW